MKEQNSQQVSLKSKIFILAGAGLLVVVLLVVLLAVDNNGNNEELPEVSAKFGSFELVEEPLKELITEDLAEGTGQAVKATDRVKVNYIGVTAVDIQVFDTGQDVVFGLDQVIAGWQDGIVGMKVGGKRRLYIPAAQAYGEQSPSPLIPPNSDLVFDIELTSIE